MRQALKTAKETKEKLKEQLEKSVKEKSELMQKLVKDVQQAALAKKQVAFPPPAHSLSFTLFPLHTTPLLRSRVRRCRAACWGGIGAAAERGGAGAPLRTPEGGSAGAHRLPPGAGHAARDEG